MADKGKSEIIQPWSEPTCAVCYGQWTRLTGQAVTVGIFTYRVCGYCVSLGKHFELKRLKGEKKK